MNDPPKKPPIIPPPIPRNTPIGTPAIGPDAVATKQIPAMTDRALLEDLTRTVKEGFRTQSTQMLEFGERLVTLEEAHRNHERELYEFKGRMMRNSSRVKTVSENDLSQESRLADVTAWRAKMDADLTATKAVVETIEAKTDAQTQMLTTLTDDVATGLRKFFSHPLVIAIAAAAGSALLGWLKGGGH